MRLALAGCAMILLLAAPVGAQTPLPPGLSPPASSAVPVPKPAKTKPAGSAAAGSATNKAVPAKAFPTKAAQGRAPAAGQPDIRKWDELAMPKPKPKPGEAVWGENQSGVRPTVGNGGGGMAIGF